LKLRLSIFKRALNDYSGKKNIRFAVIDLDISRKYPSNFVSILPKKIKANGGYHTKFERKFGDESLELAEKLLKRSLKHENDWEERLKLLRPKLKEYTRKAHI